MAKIIDFNNIKAKKDTFIDKKKINNNIDKDENLRSQEYLLFDDEDIISKIYLKEM